MFMTAEGNMRKEVGKIYLLQKQQAPLVQCHCNYESRHFRAAARQRGDEIRVTER